MAIAIASAVFTEAENLQGLYRKSRTESKTRTVNYLEVVEEKAEDRPRVLRSSEFRDKKSLPDANERPAYFLCAFSVILLQLGCRIVGPQVVLYCMQSQRCVPRAEYPVYNMTMADVTVSCTSLEKDVRVRPSQGWIV